MTWIKFNDLIDTRLTDFIAWKRILILKSQKTVIMIIKFYAILQQDFAISRQAQPNMIILIISMSALRGLLLVAWPIHDGAVNDLILSVTLENMTKTWPSKTLRAVIFGYEIHVVELQAYVRVQEYGNSVKFFSFDENQPETW